MSAPTLEAKAREALAENERLLAEVADLRAQLLSRDNRVQMELSRARFIMMEALSSLKVEKAKAKAALAAAAAKWSATRRMVR